MDVRLVSGKTGEVVAADAMRSEMSNGIRATVGLLAQRLEKKYLRQWMGTLIISSQPLESEVYLNGEFVGKSSAKNPLQLSDLLNGKYKLELNAVGYMPWLDSVTIEPKGKVTVNASLVALPGNLIVNSIPGEAKVFLNGKEKGATPLEIKGLTEGEHLLKLQCAGYYDWEEKVFVNSGQSSQCNANMKIRQGFLQITSKPAGASIYLNGRYTGKTPATLDKVDPGRADLVVKLEGYRPWSESYNIKPNDSITLVQQLTLESGLLSVASDPSTITLEIRDSHGKKIHQVKTPLLNDSLPAGYYYLIATSENYYPIEKGFRIVPDKSTRLEIQLKRMPGILNLKTQKGVEVIVDNALLAYTPKDSLLLPEGNPKIVLNSFHGSISDTIQIISGKKTDYKISFQRKYSWLLGSLLFISTLSFLVIK